MSRGGESQLRTSQARIDGSGAISRASVSMSVMAVSPGRSRIVATEAGGQGGGSDIHLSAFGG